MIFAACCANILWQSDALLAQLDRVFGYEPKGQGFESLAARQVKSLEPQRVQGFFLSVFMFESGQKFALWSLFGLYGLQNRAFRCASGSGVGNALKSHFRRFCCKKVRRRRVTGKGSNFFITPISYKREDITFSTHRHPKSSMSGRFAFDCKQPARFSFLFARSGILRQLSKTFLCAKGEPGYCALLSSTYSIISPG